MSLPALRLPCLLAAAVVLLSALSTVSGQATFFDSCPTPATVERFTKQKFDGNWFVFASSPNSLEEGWICKRLTYSETANRFRYNYKSSPTATFSAHQGTYNFPDDNVGFVEVSVSLAPLYKNSIVAGDLDNWAILRSCSNFRLFTLKYVYILTRSPNPSDAVKAAINKGIAATGVDASTLTRVEQAKC